MNKYIQRYWISYYLSPQGLCSLCGNTGRLDTTTTAISVSGVRCGRINFCICPNGQGLRGMDDIESRRQRKSSIKEDEKEI